MSVLLRVAAAIVAAAASGACGAREPANPAPPSSAPAPAPPPEPFAISPQPRGYAGELPPLPVPAFASARPPEIIRAVYTFAARHPDVLHYVPCFCGCENRGHRGNDDCFIAGRDAAGRPQWEEHGMG